MTTQLNKNYLIVSFFALSTITLSAIQAYAVYQFSTMYLAVAPMLALPFAIVAGLIPDSTVWLSHLLNLGKIAKRTIQATGLTISILIGLLFSYLVVGQSANPLISMLFFSSFQLVGILLQFITSKPSLVFVFGHHNDHELSQLDRLKERSKQLAMRFNRVDELTQLETNFNDKLSGIGDSLEETLADLDNVFTENSQRLTSLETTFKQMIINIDSRVTKQSERLEALKIDSHNSLELLHAEMVSLHQLVKTFPSSTGQNGFTLPDGAMSKAERQQWLIENKGIIELTSKSKLANVLGVSRQTLDGDINQLNGRLTS